MRIRVTASLVLAAAALAGASGQANAARSHAETRTAGEVKATLSWKGEFEDTRNFRIAIDRGGARAFDAKVGSRDCRAPAAGFACPWPIGKRPLALRNLDGDGEPEAIVEAFTGGAHCCVLALVYRWTGDKYVRDEHNFLDPGYWLVDLDGDGRVEFRTADARFAYLYGSFAESVFPIQVIGFDGGRFVDVTAEFKHTVARDARRLRRAYRERVDSRRRIGVRPALAAYVADLYLLDREQTAKRKLRAALRRGLLGRQNRFDVGPFGREYIRDLKRHLRKWGY
jgi:hypothetical protein